MNDTIIAEAVARQGGYEEVELKSLWGTVAGALGKKKSHAQQIKQRYEDMLRVSVEQEEQEEDEAQDFEVDQILDKRSHHGQVEQHLGLQQPPRRDFSTAWALGYPCAGTEPACYLPASAGTSLSGRGSTLTTTCHGSRGATSQASPFALFWAPSLLTSRPAPFACRARPRQPFFASGDRVRRAAAGVRGATA